LSSSSRFRLLLIIPDDSHWIFIFFPHPT
jgi:hypothetical protein